MRGTVHRFCSNGGARRVLVRGVYPFWTISREKSGADLPFWAAPLPERPRANTLKKNARVRRLRLRFPNNISAIRQYR